MSWSRGLRSISMWLSVSGVLVGATAAEAACIDGQVNSCTLPNGCAGESECVLGQWSPCVCAGISATVSCSVCGGTGTATCNSSCQRSACSRAEVCNNCDDDADGAIDDSAGCFNPLGVSACPTMTEVAWTFNSRGSDTSVPDDPNCTAGTCPHYAQNVDNWREIRANRNIKKFEFRVDTFDTEPNYDYLEWRELGGTSQYLHGTPTTGWYGVQVSQNLQAKPVELGFHSDPSIARPGFTIGRARVCGGSSTSMEPANLTLTRLNTGVLMGSGDVVYLKTPARPPGEKLNLVLWGTPGVDFDLYARCNALPTPTTYNYLAYSGDVQEFLSLDGAACTSPGTWYIAVHSFSGSGQFNLVVSPMYAAQERTLVKAGTNWNATQAELDAIANTLRGAGRHFFGMTEGQFLTKNFELYNNTGATCSNCGGETCIICFRNAPGTGYCCDGSQYVIFDSYRLDPEGVAHEFGHGYLAVWDEYNQSTQKPQCGHSNMAWPWGTQNNLCYEKDHTKDRYPSEAATTQPACWDGGVDTGRTPLVILGQTPDNYDYRDHDFNGFVDVVQK